MKDNKGFNLLSVIIIICVTSIASAITTGVIVNNGYKNSTGISYSDIVNDSSLNEFLEVYSNILNNYYEDVDKEKMLDSAINAMLNYLGDNYTTYLNSEETKALEEKLAGSYQGIGIEISGREIVSVITDSPAEKAGLLAGDLFLSVDGTDVSEASNVTISNLIKNSNKESVEIKVLRGESELVFNVSIGTIATSSITYKMLENNTGYIKMEIFSRTLASQVEKALNELEANGMQKLIIDLRDNTGGYLESAEDTANLFLEKGKLIYSLQTKDAKTDYYDKTDTKRDYPIVVLLNNNSASASEILAAALKDSYGAIFVGERSYGKGKVQQTYDLSDGSMAKYTSAKWLRPTGSCIDGVGLMPDYEAKLSYEYDENGTETAVIDTQLSKAIEVINAM